jgi:hypothetical protein
MKRDRIRNKNRANLKINALEGKLTNNRRKWYMSEELIERETQRGF